MKFRRIAHRGFSSEAPENTRASFALAVEGDFYGVECDIWKCLDGTYAVAHDGHLRRICGIDKEIPSLKYEQIKKYPVIAGEKRENHPVQHILCLTDYLAVIRRSDTVCPVVELKMDYTTVELREIVNLVRQYGLLERVYFISLYPSVLLRLKEELGFPAKRLQYVYGAVQENREIPVTEELERWLIENRINLDTRYTLLSRENVAHLHENGLEVNVWTVNDKEVTERMVKEWKVDMVTTEFYHEIF